MFKQILSRIPRKSSKSDSPDAATSSLGGSIQRASGGNAPCAARSNAAKRTSSVVFPASVVVGLEPLRSFKDVPNSERQGLLVSKLDLCCEVFDFADPNKNGAEKDVKRDTLNEILEFISPGSAAYTEQVISAICKMSAANLFRAFPPSYRTNAGGGVETEEEEPMFDPAWSHLQIVYEILLKCITSPSLDAKVAKKYIDHSFILKLLDLFDSEDPRERECLKTLLHRIYGKFMVHRPFIRNAVCNIFYRFVFETDRHNGIAELLEILGSVISGFTLPLKEEHKMFLRRALIPLHKPKSFGVYQQQLTFCVTQFIEKDPKLASMVLTGLVKFWPVTNSQKEVMFLSELEEVLEATNMAEFQKCMVPLFRRIGCCLNSFHFQVAERALLLWNNDHIVSLVAQNRDVILPLIFPALEKNTRSHWHQSVLNLTVNVKKMFSEMDEELFEACQNKFEDEDAKLSAAKEKRRLTWEHLETVASSRPATENGPVLTTPLTVPAAASLN